MVEMLSGEPPWHEYIGKMSMVIFRIATSDKPEYSLPDSVSDNARDFIKRCFIREPLDRPSADELLSDPFVCDVS